MPRFGVCFNPPAVTHESDTTHEPTCWVIAESAEVITEVWPLLVNAHLRERLEQRLPRQ